MSQNLTPASASQTAGLWELSMWEHPKSVSYPEGTSLLPHFPNHMKSEANAFMCASTEIMGTASQTLLQKCLGSFPL